MANDLTAVMFFSLWSGGADGNKRQNASTALSSAEVHMIKVLVDGTTFSVLSAKNQLDATVNMLTANNLTAKTWSKGDLVGAPNGGYIQAYTASEETEYYKLPSSARTKQTP